MTRLIRIGIGVATAVAAGLVVWGFIRSREEDEMTSVSEEGGGRLIRFPAERPPFAEAAESMEAVAE